VLGESLARCNADAGGGDALGLHIPSWRRRRSTRSSILICPWALGVPASAVGGGAWLAALAGCGAGAWRRLSRLAGSPVLVVRRLLSFEQGRKVYPSDFKRRTAGSQAPVLPQIRRLVIGSVASMAGFGSP
jgi:hypothetical protein